MGEYTIISEVSQKLLELMRENLVPEPVKKFEDIGLCHPDERGSAILGIYLYDIEENAETKTMERVFVDKEHYKNPPVSLNLYYMFFAHSQAELVSKAVDEQRIMGKVIQVINDNLRLDINGEFVDIQPYFITYDEKNKVMSNFENKKDIACFYKVSPVIIESEKVRAVKRVKIADISVEHKRR